MVNAERRIEWLMSAAEAPTFNMAPASAAPSRLDLVRTRGRRDLVAGSLSGFCQVFAVAPLDTIKTHLQTSARFDGPLQCARHIYNVGGVPAFFRGISAWLLMVPVSSSLLFTAYGTALACQRPLPGGADRARLAVLQHAAAGSVAGIAASVSYCPQELVKIRMQLQSRGQAAGSGVQYAGSWDCVRQVVASQGIRGLYSGYGATLFRDIPASAAWYGGYEAARRVLSGDAAQPPVWANALSGSFGGACFWLVGFPQDVAKTRVQMSHVPPAQRSTSA